MKTHEQKDKGRRYNYRLFTMWIYPNVEQAELIDKTLNVCDTLWNYFMDKYVIPGFQNLNLTKESPMIFDENAAKRELTQLRKTNIIPGLNEVDRTALNSHIKRLEQCCFNSRYRPKYFGRPQYKDLNNPNRSYTTSVTSLNRGNRTPSIEVDQLCRKLKLPLLGWIPYISAPIPYPEFEIMEATVKKVRNKYSCILGLRLPAFQIAPLVLLEPGTWINDVGIDPGLKNFLTLSTGEFISYPGFYKEMLPQISELDNQIIENKKEYGNDSPVVQRLREKVAVLMDKVKNQRREYHHRVAHYLFNKFDRLFIESISVTQMCNHTKINAIKRAWYDTGFNEFFEFLVSFAARVDKQVYFVPDEYGSSRYCHLCGYLNNQLDPDGRPGYTRDWTCPNCNHHHDRDINAAINILFNGRFMLHAPYIAAYQDQNGIPRKKYPIMNNNMPNILKLSNSITYI